MRLIVVAFSLITFIFIVSALEIDPTDDKTIEFFLDQFLEGGDPSTLESIRAEVKKHSDELLSGFLSLVGDSFDFAASDMKTQLKQFQQDFDYERLLQFVEDIFGIGSVVVSELQKNSGTVKKKIAAFIDTIISEFSSTRKKRSNEEKPQKDTALTDFLSVKQNKRKNKKHLNIIPPGFEFQNDVGENDIPSPNGGAETEQLDSEIPSGGITTGNNEQFQNGIRTQKRESGLLHSLIPIGKKQKEDDGERQEDDGKKQKEDDGENLSHDISIQDDPSDKGIIGSLNLDSKTLKDKGKELTHDLSIQDGPSDKGTKDSLNIDSKTLKDKGEELSHDISNQNGPSIDIGSIKLDTTKQEENNHETEIYDDYKDKEKKSEIFEDLRQIGELSHELIEEFVNITEIRKEQLRKNVWKATDAIKEYVDESKDRVLDLFNLSGSFLYDIFDKETEKIKAFFKN